MALTSGIQEKYNLFFNIVISATAFIGNTLILLALRKVLPFERRLDSCSDA